MATPETIAEQLRKIVERAKPQPRAQTTEATPVAGAAEPVRRTSSKKRERENLKKKDTQEKSKLAKVLAKFKDSELSDLTVELVHEVVQAPDAIQRSKEVGLALAGSIADSVAVGKISPDEATAVITHIATAFAQNPQEAKPYATLIDKISKQTPPELQKQVLNYSAGKLRESVDTGAIEVTDARLVIEATVQESNDLEVPVAYARAKPVEEAVKVEVSPEERLRRNFDVNLGKARDSIPDAEADLLKFRQAIVERKGVEAIKKAFEPLASRDPQHEITALRQPAMLLATHGAPEDQVPEFVKALAPVEGGQTGGAAEVQEFQIDLTQLSSAEGRTKARELNTRFARDPDILQDVEELKKIRTRLSSDTTMPPDAEEDVRNIIKEIRQREVNVEKKLYFGGLPKQYEQRLKTIATEERNVRSSIIRLYDDLTPQRGEIPPQSQQIRSLINDVLTAFDPSQTQNTPEGLNQRISGLQETLRASSNAADRAWAGRLEELRPALGTIANKRELLAKVGAYVEEKIPIDQRLAHINITDEHLNDIFVKVAEPEKFFAKLQAMNVTERAEAFHEFEEDVKELASKLLAVADADHERFFDDLFTTFYHDPVYNSIVDRINNLAQLLESNPDANTKVEVEVFDRKESQTYIKKEIKLNEAIAGLKTYVTREREWKRYFHNIYSLTLNRAPLETYVNYANHVQTSAIQTLMEENPELESAIRHHMHYLRVQYGLMNSWKTPGYEIYVADPKDPAHSIPIDKFVTEQIARYGVLTHKPGRGGQRWQPKDLEPWQRERLASMARGFVLGVNMEGFDTLASGGPRAGNKRFDTYFGPLHEFNPMRYDAFRWSKKIWGDHEIMYYKFHGEQAGDGLSFRNLVGDPRGLKPWDPKALMEEALVVQKKRDQKEPPRVVTEAMARDGIRLVEDDKFFGTGGIKERGAWRHEMVEHLKKDKQDRRGKTVLDYVETTKNIARVDLYVANRHIEDWYAEGEFDKELFKNAREQRVALRSIVLNRLRDIAPQEFLLLENDLVRHSAFEDFHELDRGKLDFKKTIEGLHDLVLETSRVSDYLLSKTYGVDSPTHDATPTISKMKPEDWVEVFKGISIERWQKIFPSKDPPITHEQYVEKMKKFIQKLQVVGADAIEGHTGVNDEDGRNMDAWKYCERIRSFPTHLEVKRNSNWEPLRDFVVGRALGDSNKISKTWWEVWPALRSTINDYAANPDRALEEKFQTYLALCKKMYDAYDDVHGKSQSAAHKASVYKIGYQMSMMGLKTFEKSIYARLPIVGTPAGLVNKFSSWARYSTGNAFVLQIDEQKARVWADQTEKLNLIAPSHGLYKEVSPPRKIGPFTIRGKYKWTKVHWNGGNFRSEAGARNWQVAVDVVRSYWALLPLMIIISAASQSFKDSEEK